MYEEEKLCFVGTENGWVKLDIPFGDTITHV